MDGDDRESEKIRGQQAGRCLSGLSTKQTENLINALFDFWNNAAGQLNLLESSTQWAMFESFRPEIK